MAKNDNVKDFCKEVADAIRAKKGTSDLINPQDFSAEIASIEGGGSGGESGGSNWRYFDTTNATLGEGVDILYNMIFILYKTDFAITCYQENWGSGLKAVGTDMSVKFINLVFDMTEPITIEEYINNQGGIEAMCEELGLVEITKEQFYDLNA